MGQAIKEKVQNSVEGLDAYERQYKTIDVFGVHIWNGKMKQAVKWIQSCISSGRDTCIGFANANNLNLAFENPSLKEHYNHCDRVFADGSGVRIASELHSNKVVDNINGTDLLPHLFETLRKSGESVYLFGAEESIAKRAAEKLVKRYPGLKVAGFHHGYVNNDLDTKKVICKINKSGASLLLVAMGTPLQEQWLECNRDKLSVPVKMSVGGLFDFLAEKVSRAPVWMQKKGIEWVWRLFQEPSRMWHRYVVGNPLFIYRILVEIYKQSYTRKMVFSRLKRIADIATSSMLLIFLMPVFILVSVCIVLNSKGSIFYSQVRVGKKGVLFTFWKFRSMFTNSHASKKDYIPFNDSVDSILFKMRRDPRVTSVGRFIRRYSIDELPQLWNVLKGDMSLVGPRPALPEEVEKYSTSDRVRLNVKPGITCYWQVSGRSDLSFLQQMELDKEYIKRRSFSTDFDILLKTIPAVISGKGAY